MEVLNTLIEKLEQLGDGELVLTSESGQWRFYVLDGQLLYATNRLSAVRRFSRAAHCYRPRWTWSVVADQVDTHQAWEIPLLERAITHGKISPIQVKLILRMVLEECFFEVLCDGFAESEWRPYHLESSSAYRSAALSASEARRILGKAQRLAQTWKESPLGYLSLGISPVVSDPSVLVSLPVPSECLSGNTDLWDVLVNHVSSLSKLTQVLLPLVTAQKIRFQDIPDLPLPVDRSATQNLAGGLGVSLTQPRHQESARPDTSAPANNFSNIAEPRQTALIACIDDSPVLTLSLKKILTSAGYRTLSIPEPMRGFSKLIEHQPDLILLDLMLPNADGYSVCKFLRETPVFEKTPIIILTGQDSNLDRMRARLAGATEFLTKPPRPVALLEMIEKHLDQ